MANWEVKEISGDRHPGSINPASVVHNEAIYIFGGRTSDGNLTNALFTLTLSGKFQRVDPTGEIPSPRRSHQGFAHEGKLYFLGGDVEEIDESRKKDFKEDDDGFIYTNELYRFDPKAKEKAFSLVPTSGDRMSPRANFGLAVVGDRVFVHGGYDGERKRDFLVLDMRSFHWSGIEETGFSKGIAAHSLTRFSNTEMFVVGGVEGGNTLSKKVKVFDAAKSKWQDEESLPAEFCGDEGGLVYHCAVKIPIEGSAFVFCLGGLVDSKQHPNHMLVFEIHTDFD